MNKYKTKHIYIYIYILDSSAALRAASNLSIIIVNITILIVVVSNIVHPIFLIRKFLIRNLDPEIPIFFLIFSRFFL